MNNDLTNDEALVNEFLTESRELLQNMGEDLVHLENAPEDPEHLNRVFRELHTIKGTSSFLGFESLIRVSHEAEDYLNSLRKGEARLSKRGMDALLQAGDVMTAMLEDVAAHRNSNVDLRQLISELQAVRTIKPAPRLGEVLVEQQIVSEDQVRQALSLSRATGEKIGESLVDQGITTRQQVASALAHQSTAAASGATSCTSMRIDVRKLDEMVNLAGELTLERNRLSQISREVGAGTLRGSDLEVALSESSTRLSFITDEIQRMSLKTRMVPIDTLFRRFPRMVRDVSNALGKSVRLEVSGEETELDRTLVESMADPMVHLLRNALDHGIESPERRRAQGKPCFGTIKLSARQQSDQIVVSISDDGSGIDTEQLKRKAIERGILDTERAASMARAELLELIFAPGLSTAAAVTDISGRGVGMDVVRNNIARLNGTISIESEAGAGTTIQLRVPLTLAILPILLVQTGIEVFGIPLRSVVKTLRVDARQIHTVERRSLLYSGDETIPLIRLSSLFCLDGQKDDYGTMRAVIVKAGERQMAILVDRLLGQESTVIKAFTARFAHNECISGATIGGDGHVRLVLDPAGLLQAASMERTSPLEAA